MKTRGHVSVHDLISNRCFERLNIILHAALVQARMLLIDCTLLSPAGSSIKTTNKMNGSKRYFFYSDRLSHSPAKKRTYYGTFFHYYMDL